MKSKIMVINECITKYFLQTKCRFYAIIFNFSTKIFENLSKILSLLKNTKQNLLKCTLFPKNWKREFYVFIYWNCAIT